MKITRSNDRGNDVVKGETHNYHTCVAVMMGGVEEGRVKGPNC